MSIRNVVSTCVGLGPGQSRKCLNKMNPSVCVKHQNQGDVATNTQSASSPTAVAGKLTANHTLGYRRLLSDAIYGGRSQMKKHSGRPLMNRPQWDHAGGGRCWSQLMQIQKLTTLKEINNAEGIRFSVETLDWTCKKENMSTHMSTHIGPADPILARLMEHIKSFH